MISYEEALEKVRLFLIAADPQHLEMSYEAIKSEYNHLKTLAKNLQHDLFPLLKEPE